MSKATVPSIPELKKMRRELYADSSNEINLKKIKAIEAQIAREQTKQKEDVD